MEDPDPQSKAVRILCRKLLLPKLDDHPSIQWLIGSSCLPPYTITSTLRCIHTLTSHDVTPDFVKESDDMETLAPQGFEVIGALIVKSDMDVDNMAREAVDWAIALRRLLCNNAGGLYEDRPLIGATLNSNNIDDISFFVSNVEDPETLERAPSVVYEEQPEKYLLERGCMLQCQLLLKLPVYFPIENPKDVEDKYICATEDVISNLMNPQTTYIIEANELSTDKPSLVLRGSDFDLHEKSNISSQESNLKTITCSYFCSKSGNASPTWVDENADRIHVTVLTNRSRSSAKPAAPVADYYPAPKSTRMLVLDQKLEILCYAAKDLLMVSAVPKLIIPALTSQLRSMRNKLLPSLLTQHQQDII